GRGARRRGSVRPENEPGRRVHVRVARRQVARSRAGPARYDADRSGHHRRAPPLTGNDPRRADATGELAARATLGARMRDHHALRRDAVRPDDRGLPVLMRHHRALGALGACSILAAVTLVGPGASGQVDGTGTGYSYYLLRASGQGVVVRFTVNGFLPVDDLVSLSSVTAESTYGSNGSNALAALPDPGDLIRTLPGTLSGLTGIEGLPPYPAAAAADYPAVPDDDVQLAPDGGIGVGHLTAHADETSATATAATTNIADVVGLLPSFSIGSIKATTASSRLRASAFRSIATTTVSDVRLLGGLLRIDQITSEVTTELVDGRLSAQASKVDVSGAEVAGQPIGITDKGIVALGQSVALAPVVSSLAAPLTGRGILLHTTPSSESIGDGEATASGGSLVIEIPIDVQGRPGSFTLTLAQAESHVEASGDNGTLDQAGAAGDTNGDL